MRQRHPPPAADEELERPPRRLRVEDVLRAERGVAAGSAREGVAHASGVQEGVAGDQLAGSLARNRTVWTVVQVVFDSHSLGSRSGFQPGIIIANPYHAGNLVAWLSGR